METPATLLLSSSDLLLIHDLLKNAASTYLQESEERGASLLEQHQDALKNICEAVVSTLQQVSGAADSVRVCTPEVGCQVDAEVLQLYKQVVETSTQLDQLRQTMPLIAVDHHTRKLKAARPVFQHQSAGQIPPEDKEDYAKLKKPRLTEALAVEQLNESLTSDLNKLPGIRAHLEQSNERLQRVLDAIEAEQFRPSPKTVERVLLGTMEDTTGVLQPDEAAAAIKVTRHRIATELTAL